MSDLSAAETSPQGDPSRTTVDGLEVVASAEVPSGREVLSTELGGLAGIAYDPAAATLPNGVASGDVTTDGIVLWTRSLAPGEVTFTVAEAAGGAAVAEVTATVSDPDVPVKVAVDGLTPGTDYRYDVVDAAGASRSGVFSTVAEDGRNGLTFGISGDWRGDLLPYPAISNADDATLDFFVFGGDTIYADFDSPALPATMELDGYREKYQEVYGAREGVNTFADLRASTALYATIDDHEVVNDFAGGAPAASDPRFPEDSGLVNDTTAYEAGLRAFQDYHPVRDEFYGDTGDERTAGERQLYRAQEFGEDAALFVLDQRSFRDGQIESATGGSPADVARFLTESFDPSRTFLGDVQLDELKSDLLAADAGGVTWKFVFSPEPIQNLGLYNSDSWDGYQAERTVLLSFIDENRIDNVVFVAADIHGTLVNNVTYTETPFGPQLPTSAFEITTGSVGFSPPFGPAAVDVATALGLLTSEQRAFYDSLAVAPDDDGIVNDKDDFLASALNSLTLEPAGLDPVGLDDNLAEAEGLIDATLLQGGYVSAHTFGWTEFDIDADTQALTTTTYGIPAYTPDDVTSDPPSVLALEPQIVSQFVVNPELGAEDLGTDELSIDVVAEFVGEGGEGASEVVAEENGAVYVTNGALGRIDVFQLPQAGSMANGINNYAVDPIFTVGETLPSTSAYAGGEDDTYTPIGVLDGLGAYALDGETVRVFANHEVLNNVGYAYELSDGDGGAYTLNGARISYFDIDTATRQISDSGLAYNTIVDANGDVASDNTFLGEPFATAFGGVPGDGAQLEGLSRFCSGVLVEAGQFDGRGLADTIYFAGEEDGGGFSSIGGAMWALDPETGTLHQVPMMGRGAWENVAEIDTGTDDRVAFILSDDTSPFDADDLSGGDPEAEAAPLYMYVGTKDAEGGFLARNGLADGTLYVWVSDTGEQTPLDFNGSGTLGGSWVAIDNAARPDLASEDGSTGYDEYGYPTQRTLWSQAEAAGSFGFSRPEDVATNPNDGTEFVLASTGVDTYAVDPESGDGADTFGTVYTMKVDFSDIDNPDGALTILYDGDADPDRALRSPDNVEWTEDGFVYVQEDKAEDETLTGEPLFGPGAVNPDEAGIIRIDADTGELTRVATIDRSAVLDPSTTGTPVDIDAGTVGEWETSGVLDVSSLFGETPGSLFLFDVQAHGIADQDEINPDSRISDGDLVEGGQLAFLEAPSSIDLATLAGFDGVQSVDVKNGIVAAAISRAAGDSVGVNFSQPGFIAFFDAKSGELISRVDVGNLPDSVKFTPDGTKLVVANEGEANADTATADNPSGTVSIVDVSDPASPAVQSVDFTVADGLEDVLRDNGVRVSPDTSFSRDAEPEFIAINDDGTTAYVSLQENNAYAEIDLAAATVRSVFSAGTTDYGDGSNALDPLDDGAIDIEGFDDLVGLRMPDGIATYEIDGATYLFGANEGDGRGDAEDGFDEARVGDVLAGEVAGVSVDPSVDTEGLERLTISSLDGDTDGDGDIDVLNAFGSRSFTIYDDKGNVVFDSGPEFEQIIAELAPERFNDDDGTSGENRSDAKGPEPEAVAVGEVSGEVYAFIGLERDSGIMVYNVSDPSDASFVDYIAPKFVDATPAGEVARQGPETIEFVSADDSSTGNALIVVGYEISGTTIAYQITPTMPSVAIYDIQGAGHVSAFAGDTVATSGIVTAVDFNGYYLQDADGDGDDATSDALFVFTGTGSDSPVVVGDAVEITGAVTEFIPGGAETGNLSTTQLTDTEVTVVSSGNELPEAVTLGEAGRAPPTEVVISRDETPVNLQTAAGEFDPDVDGIDFYESLEAMRVTIDDPVAVSPTNQFDETWVLSDDGAGSTPGLNDRGGINLAADTDGLGDLNPERIQVQYDAFSDLLPEGFSPPALQTGDELSDITGVVGYAFGNFEVLVTDAFDVEEVSTNALETTTLDGTDDRLTVATYNVLNIGPTAADADQLALLGEQIAQNLGAPDILALQEIQDDNGEPGDPGNTSFVDTNGNGRFDGDEMAIDDGVLSADGTLQALVDAIAAAGGPSYEFVSADVASFGATGGAPGSNIRNAFLWNADRVSLDEAVTLTEADLTALGATDPDAFAGSRDPFLGTFTFNGETVSVIDNHLSSRFGSEPIFGGPQPFNQGGEAEREAQTRTLNEVVDVLLADDADANIVVAGDLNTFQFTDELTEDLPGVGDERVLTNLIDEVDAGERYTFNFQGNSQVLDHVFVTDPLVDGAEADVVHLNTDFAEFASDHEPVVASLLIERDAPLFLAGTGDSDTLTGGSGDDTILGRGNADTIDGRGGADALDGGAGRDVLVGGTGEDTIGGGRGRDAIDGGSGDDLVLGGDARDILTGGLGTDTLMGGNGGDVFVIGEGADLILDFAIGADRLALSGASGLTFADVEFEGTDVTSGDDLLATLFDVDASALTASDFEMFAV